ncbi:nicotinate-nucleotide--dimethylbenzimidazole phosphoribosyltransferase [Streptomyces sp. NPDC001315]|uniref:nicotinate-nucleotide--dimethylbenzimidazole phosphoribosyltransferase n=1 Tax=Streptomyces sp. NPDC001315 TaxID=3364562 RepID=UPI00368B1D7F
MTDTGQIPGEGLPENAGMVEQPGVAAPGAYTYLSETTAEDEDLLLLPGAQSAWGNEVAPPVPEPVVEAVHEPGPHELAGRDSGSVDLSGVRLPNPTPPSTPSQPRRPLHLGPPIPDASASPVRSLADRGPAGAPVRQQGPSTTGPEYLDVQQLRETPPQGAAPWGAPTAAQPPVGLGATPAETVVPPVEQQPEPVGAAQAVMARIATEAVAATAQVPPQAQDGGYAVAPAPSGPVAAPAFAAEAAEPVGAAHGEDAGEVPAAVHDPGAGSAEDEGHALGAAAAAAAAGADGRVPGPEAAGESESGRVQGPEAVVEAGQVQGPAVWREAGQGPGPGAVTETGQIPGPAAVTETGQTPGPVAAAEAGQVPGPEPVADADQAHGAVAAADAALVPAPEPVSEAAQDAGAVIAVDAAQVLGSAAVVDAAQGPGAAVAVEDEQATGTAVVVDAAQAPGAAEQAPAPSDVPVADQAAEAVAPSAEAHAPETVQAPEPAPAAPAEVTPGSPQGTEAVAVAQSAQVAEAVAPEYAGPEAPQVQEPAVPEAAAPQPAQAPETVEPAPGPEAMAFAPVPSALDAARPPHPADESPAPAEDVAASAEESPESADTDQVTGPEQTPQEAQPPARPAPVAADAQDEVQPPAADVPGTIPLEPQPDRPMGEFVPVEGQVPTTPHLAPTPPHPIVLPAQAPEPQAPHAPEPVAMVPAPREADPAPVPAPPDPEPDPDVVQQAEDLDTRAAEQEDQEEESTAAVEEARESTGPAAPGYDDAEREAVLRVMRERRDIRNGFRSDPIPHEVLLRVLEAAHTAPSVGHSQPWDFVVIRSAETRRTMHELAMRQRDAYAKSLPKGRAKQFKELKIEAILDTPVNIVVTADPTRGGRHTLGRHTQPQMAPYSSALAVENLWLAARAEGLGVGWVSFFDEREMVRALGLPDHLEVVAYLCVGYVDEFPDEPELMQAGWSKRRPLSWVVHEETYGRRALPGEDPHDLLAETVAGIRPLDAKALGEAWERQKRMTKPAGALGMLEIISAQLSGLSRQCPPPIPEPAAVAIFAGDHGVHAQGVTPWPQEVTAQMVANFLGGGAVCNAFAGQVGAEVCVVDVGVAADLPATPGLLPRKVRAGTSDMTTGPAMTREEAKQAIEVGIETARDLVAAGNKALLTGEMGIANTTASAALISVFTGVDPAEVTGRGTGINDETLARKTEVVRRALELHQPDPADPIGVLAAIGGFEHAAMVGLLLGGASLRTPVILDGVSAGAAALVARAIAPEVLAACIAGHRSAEPGHVAALNKLGLRPLVDLDLRLGEGTGALLALPLVQSTARAMHEVATFDSAGVTEK